ncbi:MAG: prolipoprotein diacylglyceryl transferase [Planctomycetes bacterium]|nr:prolipoprotein diacylglyceryl transferase [Planctomycetota bacterium]
MKPELWRIPHVPEVAFLACIVLGAPALYQVLRSWRTQGRRALAGLVVPAILIALIAKFAVLDHRFETIPIFSYGVCIMFGFLAAIGLAAWRARREGIDPSAVLDMGIMAVVAGIVGSRLLHVLQFWATDYAGRPWYRPLEIYRGGLVFYGGLLLAAPACILLLRQRGIPMWRMSDIAAPSVPLGLAIGRIGCFLNGCCWGARCAPDFTLGVRFPHDSPAWHHHVETSGLFDLQRWKAELLARGDSADWYAFVRDTMGWDALYQTQPILRESSWPVHPTQLYEATAAFLLCAFLTWWYRHRRGEGELLWLMGSLYASERFVMETIRGDTHSHPMVGPFTMSQFIALASALCVPIWLFFRYFRKSGRLHRGTATY